MVPFLTPKQLQEKLNNQETICVLDVREDWEYEICRLEKSLHIPLGDLENRLQEIPYLKTIVVVCHHGIRSQKGALKLIRAGFSDVLNLSGGIDAWAKEVDPGIGFY